MTQEALKLALEALESNKPNHLYCEDTWYSCPKHEDGCANEAEGDECNCGADEVNAQFDQAITSIKEALAQEQEPVAIEYWLQETMESGRWVTTGNMSMATAKRILSDEDYCEVYPQGRIVEPSPPQRTEQEPVAWIHNFIDGGISIGKRPADLERHPDRWTALYKDPKPCPTCEALARTVMLDQTSHDTTPPQRTWAGLTNEEKSGFNQHEMAVVKYVSKVLQEKNT